MFFLFLRVNTAAKTTIVNSSQRNHAPDERIVMRQNYDANLTKPVLKTIYRNREAAEYLGVSPNTLNNWRVQGKSPKFSKANGANGMIFYSLNSLVGWLEAGERSSTSGKGKGY